MLTDRTKEGNNAQADSPKSSIPAISLPKGGGAIRGIGEKFAANPVTGTGSLSVPIATSPGRAGFGPQLSLSYDSGAGNGPFGFGWSLSLPSITRKTDKGLPQYRDAEDSDELMLSGAEDLVPVLVQDAQGKWEAEVASPRPVGGSTYTIRRYRPRIEGLFARIERWTNQADPQDTFWRSISKDNITTWYGRTEESRIADPADPTRIFSWLICESYDDKGNVIVYRYKAENSDNVDSTQAHERNRTDETRKANRYLKRISYGNRQPYFPELKEDTPWPVPLAPLAPDGAPNWLFEVVFDYEDGHYTEAEPDAEKRVFARAILSPPENARWTRRLDPFSSYRAGFEIRTYRLCQRVLMFHHFPAEQGTPDYLVRSTDFTYSYEDNPQDTHTPIFSFLHSVSQSGYTRLLMMLLVHFNKMTRVSAYVLPLLLAGCATVVFRQANKTLLDFLEDGKTTKEVVILKLGAPSGAFEGERIITYQLGKMRDGYFVLDQIAEERLQKEPWLRMGIEGTFSLVLVFDENNVLQKHSSVQIW